jgi:phasin
MPENVAREFVEKGAARGKETYGKAQGAAEETTKIVAGTYSAASKGVADFNVYLLQATQTNMNAAFDLARQLARVTSPAEFFELSTAHMRKQLETFTEQTKELNALAQKTTAEATQPIQSVTKAFDRS